MRKRGLKDVKRRNRQVIVESVMEESGLSRVEIAHKTELAASTVSGLVGELLEEGILTEAGTVTTAGRSRTALMINPEYGSIVVFEIGRRESFATCFDMALKSIRSRTLARTYVAGNDLLALINSCIDNWQQEVPKILGIGLLFQEDMRESDFRVMYSTGFSSASITLREALVTQYRIPIEEEYSVSYTVTNALAAEQEPATRNSAHISVGSRVLASVTLNGAEVPLRSDFCEELACMLERQDENGKGRISVGEYLSNLIALLCLMFPLETVFLSGEALPPEETVEELYQTIGKKMHHSAMPCLKLLGSVPRKQGSTVMAAQVRRKTLVV